MEVNAQRSGWGVGAADTADARLLRRHPGTASLLEKAKRRIPGFAFDYLEGGVGDERCIMRNRQALDEIEIVPRYGEDIAALCTRTSLFGQSYNMPLGVAPMGLSGLVWPQADMFIAEAAEKANIPFILSMVSNADIETICRIAPNTTWQQMYAVPQADYQVVFDMVDRADRAGARVLVLTMDTPMRQKRLRDTRNGLTLPFRATMRTIWQVATSPAWALEVLRRGQPRFANFLPHVEGEATPSAVAYYVNRNMVGPTTWALIQRVRARWKKPLVLKGIQHGEDAAKAVELGIDGLIVSNHGGRQFDAAPAALDVLSLLRARLGPDLPIMVDGSILSGLDILKSRICGADFVFSGRPFLAAAAALGKRGPAHIAAMYRAELSGVMGQCGVTDITELGPVTFRMNRAQPFAQR